MAFDSSSVRRIAQEHIDTAKDPAVRALGQDLLNQWQGMDPLEAKGFCRKIARPAIRENLRGKARKRAIQILNEVKEEIADISAVHALVMDSQRSSVRAMQEEIIRCYEVINRQGRGIVYLGSARTMPGDSDYEQARELGRRLTARLGSTAWSGAGPGQMEAPLRGAQEAGGKVGGIKINLNGDQAAIEQNVSSVFAPGEVSLCEFFAPRKIGLVDAATPREESERTGVVVFPGGFGTLDEFYEIVVLKQLKKIGTKRKVPLVMMNYDGFYDPLFEMHNRMLAKGKISQADLENFDVCNTNDQAVEYFSRIYGISEGQDYLWAQHSSEA